MSGVGRAISTLLNHIADASIATKFAERSRHELRVFAYSTIAPLVPLARECMRFTGWSYHCDGSKKRAISLLNAYLKLLRLKAKIVISDVGFSHD
jgi:hypothetical protein